MLRHTRAAWLALLCWACGAPAAEVALTVFHTNDLHQSLPNLPRFAGHVAAWRAEHPPTLFLDGGDWLDRGSPVATVTRGETIVGALARMGYDGLTFGNHDWIYGDARLAEFAETSGLRFLCANLATTRERLPRGLTGTWLVEVGGVKVGIFGLTLDTYAGTAKTRPDLRVTPAREAAVAAVADLRRQGAELVLALTHLGFEPMAFEAPDKLTDTTLAATVPGLDVIVGGHTHTLLQPAQIEALRQRTGVVVVQAGAMGQHLGRLDLVWDTTARQVVRYQAQNLQPAADWPVKAEVAAWLDAQYQQVMPQAQRVVGAVDQPLELYNLGAWYAEFLRSQAGADVALVYRKCLYDEPARFGPAPALTFEQLASWLPRARVTRWRIPRAKLAEYLAGDQVRDRLCPLHDQGRPFSGDAIYYAGCDVTFDPATGQVACALPDQETLTVASPWPFTEWGEVRAKGDPPTDEIARRPVLGGLRVEGVEVLPQTTWELLAAAAAAQPLTFTRRWPQPDPLWEVWRQRWTKPAGG